ncbi:creatininase family protein [Halorarum halobium]|uniref:creatininase family protein n=1 Tax=Halorarum halobium TaxID=3075121 RepID=UPI0028A7F019|nr:creatininase family protein [Halobaculum sp. XH14]
MAESTSGVGGTWAESSAPEIRRLAERPGSIVVVPVGSVEQHGDHLPVATDAILAGAVAGAAVERVEADVPVIATPVVAPGFSPHHLSFGGTLSLRRETLVRLLTDVAESALDGGFDALLFVNGHRGNDSIVGSVVGSVGAARPDVDVGAVTYFDLAAPFVDDVRRSDVGGMSHGGEFETSLMLHLRPSLVDESRFEVEYRREPHEHGVHDMFESGPLGRYRDFADLSSSGVVGDPSEASAETGDSLFEGLTTELAAVLEELHDVTTGTERPPSSD